MLAFQIVSVLGDIDRGCSCARMALPLASKTRHKLQLPFVYVVVYGLVLILVEPVQASSLLLNSMSTSWLGPTYFISLNIFSVTFFQ